MVVWSFESCGILNCLDSDVHSPDLLEGQLHPDSDDELNDPFNEAETLMWDFDL